MTSNTIVKKNHGNEIETFIYAHFSFVSSTTTATPLLPNIFADSVHEKLCSPHTNTHPLNLCLISQSNYKLIK